MILLLLIRTWRSSYEFIQKLVERVDSDWPSVQKDLEDIRSVRSGSTYALHAMIC